MEGGKAYIVYIVGFWITAIVTFLICWIYAIVTYGFFIGVGLGWIPSLMIAFIAGLVWPLIALVAGLIAVVVIYFVSKS